MIITTTTMMMMMMMMIIIISNEKSKNEALSLNNVSMIDLIEVVIITSCKCNFAKIIVLLTKREFSLETQLQMWSDDNKVQFPLSKTGNLCFNDFRLFFYNRTFHCW